ncbi:hypothetical protein QJS04_geneDACA000194 [Acorus gramineus]|uniref:Uncharacterized protein n=1 Tax=Acorus gramineus TaxID=55184 RepID=A0AAV9AQV4_ACOGR|nr:hypothetical protein QJS04_geneDACA000194 [Acorus gramineus]
MGRFLSLSVLFEERESQWKWICSVVYDPNEDTGRLGLWEELNQVKYGWGLPSRVLGDF